ncbi:hypothetical protein F5Y16DRAFT_363008 [Xylariaceae sp. FL0255]|nr:hypothetical protein F5Y16DRAFT_363008 [Xylariaceae sp. FL0255]
MLRSGSSIIVPAGEGRSRGQEDQEREESLDYEIEIDKPTLSFDPDETASATTTPTTSRLRAYHHHPDDQDRNPLSYAQHQRQQSAPDNYFMSPTRRVANDIVSSSTSPTRSSYHVRHQSQQEIMALTGDRRASPSRNNGWRTGSPRSGNEQSNIQARSTPRDLSTPPPNNRNAMQTTTRIGGFFATSMSALTSRMSGQQPQTPTSPARIDDELYNLDIEAALYPSAPSSPYSFDGTGEAFSPAAYKNLQITAAGLLHKMQDAYRSRTSALRELQDEREVQKEEVEELGARASNFKTQLEKMAVRAAEQEDAIQKLVADLKAEKDGRRRDREKMMMLAGNAVAAGVTDESEDLGVDDEDERRRRRWRESIDNTDVESAESESIFSRSRSPTSATTCTFTTEIDNGGSNDYLVPPQKSAILKPLLSPTSTPPAQQQQPQQPSTIQRLVKGLAGSEGSRTATQCQNCHGQDSRMAWDTVGLLRAENIALKNRVTQLEVSVEGALDAVNGVGIF